MCNKQTNINLKLKQLKTISQVVTTMAKQWHCGEELVAVQTMRSNHLSKPRLLLYFLLVNTCFSETTIQPTQKDGCPLFLVHGGSGWRLPIFSSTLSSLLSLKLLLPGGSDIFLMLSSAGGSRLKRAEVAANPTEWAGWSGEGGEGGSPCLYRSISGSAKLYI